MAAVTTASFWSVWWRWQPRFWFVILVAVATAYCFTGGGDDRLAIHDMCLFAVSPQPVWFRLAFGRLSTVLCFAQLRDAMPTAWFYIKGCPFPDECNALKTSSTAKRLKWTGKTGQEAVDKCAHHLMQSQLHRKTKKDAYQAAWDGLESYEDNTEDEADVGDATPPQPTKRSRMAIADEALSHGDDDSADPLVTQIAMQVEKQVERLRERRQQSSSSTLLVRTDERRAVLHAAVQNIADAEAACRKAQGFAQSAAQAFGEVASKLNRARLTLN